MVIDPVRDGTVIVLARDGRYLEASFGGTPWTDIRPRSTYLLSTCVDDRVLEAPIIKRVIDISGCEVLRRERPVIAKSAIPFITFSSHVFVFGPIVLPAAPSVVRGHPSPLVHPPVLAASAPPLNIGLGAIAGIRHLGFPSTSATGAGGTILIAGGNAYTFQWGNGVAWARLAPLHPPTITHGGLISAAIVPHRTTPMAGVPPFIGPGVGAPPLPPGAGPAPSVPGYTGAVPPVPGVPHVHAAIAPPVVSAGAPPVPGPLGTLPLPPGAGPAPSVPGYTGAVPPVPGVPHVHAAIAPPVVSAGAPPVPGPLGTLPLPPGAGPAPSVPGYTGAVPPVPGVPHVHAAIAPPSAINAAIIAPSISGTLAAPTIAGQPASHPVFGPAFTWVAPLPGIRPLVSDAIRSPLVPRARFAVASIVSPLSLLPVAHSNILAASRTVAGSSGTQLSGTLGFLGQGTVSAPVANHVRGHSNVVFGVHAGSPPTAHGVYASSFHTSLNAFSGSPVVFGRRR